MTGGKPRIVETTRIYKGWNTVDLVTVEAPDAHGTLRRHRRELVDHGQASIVLPVDRARGVAYLVKQWRTGILMDDDPYLLEACGGIIDPGETPEEAARREGEEEVGLRLGVLRSLGTIFPSIGTLTEKMYLFVAEVSESDRVGNGGGVDDGEDIEILEVPLAELFEMARDGRIPDAKTLIIVQRLMLDELGAP